MLALFLAKTEFGTNRAITILGFSLGTVITMHCIRVLKKFYKAGYYRVGKFLCDVHLWGGAVILNPNN